MTACLHGRYSPMLAKQPASEPSPARFRSCSRLRHDCTKLKLRSCCFWSFEALSFNTPGHLQRLPNAACSAIGTSNQLMSNELWPPQADDETEEQMLGWSLQEHHLGLSAGQHENLAARQEVGADAVVAQRHQQKGLRRQQKLKRNRQQEHQKWQQRHGILCAQTTPTSSMAGNPQEAHVRMTAPAASNAHPSNKSVTQRAKEQQQLQQQHMIDDGYAAAQQRVQQLLTSADIKNPQAAADALLDTVNDIVTALQMLATAAKPSGLSAIKQYAAATQQLAAAVVHKFKQHMLRQQQQQQLEQQQQQTLTLQHTPSVSIYGSGYTKGCDATATIASAAAAAAPAPAVAGAVAVAVQPSLAAAVQGDLAAALAGLPPTKLAATTFSLGVLRQYDTELVIALEEASLHILQRSSSSSRPHSAARASSDRHFSKQHSQQQPCHQRQQPGNHNIPVFSANQLGQLAQGFVYLDHSLSPTWQAAYLQACRQQLQYMKGPQLASVAVFLLHTRQATHYRPGSAAIGVNQVGSSTHSAGLNSTGVHQLSSSSSSALQQHCPTVLWIEAFLAAAGQQANGLKPQQLVQVLQAAAALYQDSQQQQQPQQQQQHDDAAGGNSIAPAPVAAARVFGGLPVSMAAPLFDIRRQPAEVKPPPAPEPGSSSSYAAALPKSNWSSSRRSSSRGSSSSGDSSSSCSWLLPLLVSFHQQLPDMKLAQVADGLTALAQLTATPWPQQLQQQLLLQLQLLLPAAAGRDVVTAVAALAKVVDSGPVSILSADNAFSDALLQRLHSLLPTLGPSELAGTVETLAHLRVKPYKAWLYELFARLRVEARFMTGHEVLAVIEGLAMLRVPLDPEVLHLFVIGVKRWMGVLGSVELRRLVAAVRLMYPRVLPGRTVAQVVEELERRAALLELHMV